MSMRSFGRALGAAVLLTGMMLPALTAAAARPTPSAPPVRVRAVLALDAHQHASARFHRGDLISLRVRWQVLRVRPGDRETVLWAVRFGRQVVYRHYHRAVARVGRWYWTTRARLPRTARPGVYTFEGKVVIGHKASWRVLTFRVVP